MKPRQTLIICIILSATADGRATEGSPVYITAQQVKAHWLRNFPTPRPLDRDYHTKMRARKTLMVKLRKGDYDLKAEQVAATHNRSLAIQARDLEAAFLFESEIQRISDSILAEKKLTQDREIAEQQQRLLLRIEAQLLDSNRALPRQLAN